MSKKLRIPRRLEITGKKKLLAYAKGYSAPKRPSKCSRSKDESYAYRALVGAVPECQVVDQPREQTGFEHA